MVLKGNLCWNGDLETGTTEEWSSEYWDYETPPMWVIGDAGVDGGYALYIPVLETGVYYGLCYDKIFPFEERELYFVEVYGKVLDASVRAVIQFLDGKKRPLGECEFGNIFWNDEWGRMCAVVARRYGASYFRVGFIVYSTNFGDVYLDNLSVIGLTHSRDWMWSDFHQFLMSGEGFDDWYCNIAVMMKHSYNWVIEVQNISGSSPAVNLSLRQILPRGRRATEGFDYTFKVSDTFTDEEVKVYEGSTGLFGYYVMRINSSGADTEATVNTHLSLIPFI